MTEKKFVVSCASARLALRLGIARALTSAGLFAALSACGGGDVGSTTSTPADPATQPAGNTASAAAAPNSATTNTPRTASANPFPLTSSDFVDGTGIAGDSLANSEIGGPEPGDRSIRFRAKSSGSLTGARLYVYYSTTSPGYSAGTGGIIHFELQEDDNSVNHFPSGRVLASTQWSNPLSSGATIPLFPLIQFGSPAPVVAGRFYHLVLRNTHSDARNNFISINSFMHTRAAASAPANHPKFAAQEWDELYRHNGVWRNWQDYFSEPLSLRTPIAEFQYADGQAQGQVYMESAITITQGGNGSCGGPKAVTGNWQARQTYQHLGGARSAFEVGFRLKRELAQAGDSLQLTVEDGSGNILRTASVDASSTVSNQYEWVKFKMSPALDMTTSAPYRLRLSTSAASRFVLFPLRKGTSTNDPANVFNRDLVSSGRAEYNSGGGWNGWDQWCAPNRSDFDHQFYIASR